MDQDREQARPIEDLPVEAADAAEVKGGLIDPNDKSLNFTSQSVDAKTIKSFSWGGA